MSNPLSNPPQPTASSFSIDLVLEAARGLAALWVFLFHVAPIVAESLPALHSLALIGYYGVPVFFVVSGYCIFAAAQRAKKTVPGANLFMRRRALRIFPTFWVSILVVMCTPYLMELIAAAKTAHFVWPQPKWAAYTLIDWVGVVTLTKELLDARGGHDAYSAINAVYWTLAIEIQFYMILYAAIICGKRWIAFLVGVSICCALAGLFHILWINGLFVRFWFAFVCGIVLRFTHTGGLTPSRIFKDKELVGASLGLLLLAVAVWRFPPEVGDTPSAFVVIAALTALGLWCLGGIENAMRARAHGILARRAFFWCFAPFAILGQCSYSLYLLHVKVAQLPEMFVRQVIRPTNPLYLLLTVTLTVAVSYLFYRVVERKFQRHPVDMVKLKENAIEAVLPQAAP